ncbi:TPA: sugar 3,4-ketoisomerase [Aeromonas hydrophila]
MSLIKTIDFDILGDARGSLVSLESNKNIPFDIRRVYYIFGTQKDVGRGFHAHKQLKQVAVCVKGNCRFILDDGHHRVSVLLASPSKGLYIDGVTWREMHDFSEDCVLMVLASEHYDESDYIRDYQEFLEVTRNVSSSSQ